MKFAVIGCGKIAKKAVIPAILKSDIVELVVVIDRNHLKESEIKSLYGCNFATSLHEANEKFKFDAVYISTPIGVHKKYIIEAANFKKHILCEKSIVSSYEDAQEIIEVCKANNVALFEGFMYQFHPQHDFVKKLLSANEIGTPFHIQAWFGFPPLPDSDFRYSKNLGGGSTLDAGAYTIHFARNFFKSEPRKIYSILEKESQDVDIRGSVMLDFGNSKSAHCVFGFNNLYQNNYVIWGTNGKITLSRAFAVPSDFSSTLLIERPGMEIKNISMPTADHFQIQFEMFSKGALVAETREQWYVEINSQSKALSIILES